MHVLIDIGHPSQVHLFRNFIDQFKADGHRVTVTAKEKDMTLQLLDDLGIEYTSIGKVRCGLVWKLLSSLGMIGKLVSIIRKDKPDLLISKGSPYLGVAGRLTGKEHLVYCADTEIGTINEFVHNWLATHIVGATWSSAQFPVKKTTRVPILKELAYLHPRFFQQNANILDQLGVRRDERFFLVRFVAWNAHHDVGHKGMSVQDKRDLVNFLEQRGKVFISSEAELPEDMRKYEVPTAPNDIHQVLSFASLHVGEGGTMITESAVVGTPAIFVSPVAKKLSNFDILENKYRLVWSFEDSRGVTEKIDEILNETDNNVWLRRRDALIDDTVDTTSLLREMVMERSCHEPLQAQPKRVPESTLQKR